jgi:hypothetical protein
VLTWQRWLIADARKGAAHGGLGFTGDTLAELVKALHEDGAHSSDGTWHFQVLVLLVRKVDGFHTEPIVSCTLRLAAVIG